MMTDPIADMLTRIRNAGSARHAQTSCPSSKVTLAIAGVLQRAGFIDAVKGEAFAGVWFAGGFRDTAIWSRLDLPTGARIEGPAILEQPDATTVIEPGLAGRIDALGNLIVEAQ